MPGTRGKPHAKGARALRTNGPRQDRPARDNQGLCQTAQRIGNCEKSRLYRIKSKPQPARQTPS
jgi:hypothetical protein